LAIVSVAMAVQIEGCTGQPIDFPLIDDEPDLVELQLMGKSLLWTTTVVNSTLFRSGELLMRWVMLMVNL